MNKYLKSSQYIDWENAEVFSLARSLSADENDSIEVSRKCFEFVRDEIKHSLDFKLNPVTCKASDVLKYGTGYCYAKSHLLAALLRANNVPAGLCYQRLTVTDVPPFCLHGLNAVYLENIGWYRIDARGNKKGVEAEFAPPIEQLAFLVSVKGEADFQEIWSEPLPIITEILERGESYQWVAENLPDIELSNG